MKAVREVQAARSRRLLQLTSQQQAADRTARNAVLQQFERDHQVYINKQSGGSNPSLSAPSAPQGDNSQQQQHWARVIAGLRWDQDLEAAMHSRDSDSPTQQQGNPTLDKSALGSAPEPSPKGSGVSVMSEAKPVAPSSSRTSVAALREKHKQELLALHLKHARELQQEYDELHPAGKLITPPATPAVNASNAAAEENVQPKPAAASPPRPPNHSREDEILGMKRSVQRVAFCDTMQCDLFVFLIFLNFSFLCFGAGELYWSVGS